MYLETLGINFSIEFIELSCYIFVWGPRHLVGVSIRLFSLEMFIWDPPVLHNTPYIQGEMNHPIFY
jgi:hypothetical protein